MYEAFGKRVLDVVLASIGMVFGLVAMVPIAAAIRLRMGSPVLFRHERTGRHGERFEMFKFRTMELQVPGAERSSTDRVTKLGQTLRSLSLDELPQLLNVVRGDMSLVGPRPLLPAYDSLYSAEQLRRFEVRPGVTGLAQISGRSHLGWTKKFALDVAYVDDVRFLTDLKIITTTVRKLSDRSSTVADGGGIQERFDGTN